MKQFDLYTHPVVGHEVVKNGFSWPGFFFTWIWLLICRLWGHGIAVAVFYSVGPFVIFFAGGVLIGLTMPISDADLDDADLDAAIGSLFVVVWLLSSVVVNLVVGIKGNQWRRNNLVRKRGFEHLKTVQATTSDAALLEVSQEGKSRA